jgi:tetratricopeptide (TPR) repeat protein
MRTALFVLLAWLLTACQSVAPLPAVNDMFRDAWFSPPTVRINPQDALAATDEMREYARSKMTQLTGHVDLADRRRVLIDTMYRKGGLRLDYDSSETRTASEAFKARTGNCLSLVLLTSAMAKELRLPVRYQSVVGVADWSQADNLFVSIGHVNLVMDQVPSEIEWKSWSAAPLVVDFLPPDQASVLETHLIEEETVLAMYLNNRAVESLIKGQTDNAYWWARAALLEDPSFISTYVTFGVIYRTVHHPEMANFVLERASSREPDNTTILSDRILVLRDMGKVQEAKALSSRLAALDPHPPMSYYNQAQAEMNAGHFESARRLYEKEIARDPFHHEFEFGLARVYFNLNDMKQAAIHLKRAMDISTSKEAHNLYASKLEHLNALYTHSN